MTMSKEDILKEYNEAKDKNNQITILADMNTTTRGEIVDILLEMGIAESELPKRAGRRKGVKMKRGGESDMRQQETQMEADEDRQIIIGAILRAAVEEEEAIETLEQQIEQNTAEIKERRRRIGIYNRYEQGLREQTKAAVAPVQQGEEK